MFTGEAVVTEWSSLSVSCVDDCVNRTLGLSGSSALLLMPLPSFGPESN